MKHILLIAILSLVLVACGKTNSTNSGSSAATYTNPAQDAQILPTNDYTAFKAKVDNAQFAPQGYTSVEYYFSKSEGSKGSILGGLFSGWAWKSTGSITRKYSSSTSTPVFAHEKAADLAGLLAF